MTQTLDSAGQPLFFPPSLETDEAGVILPRPEAELTLLVEQVAPHELLPLLRKLINGTSKRKRQKRWSAVNLQRMELARLCIERVIAEGICCPPPSYDA